MAYVYKQFTAQDKAIIPFNAHKQYNFNSASALTNSVTFFNARWTSESYDLYSSGSASADSINILKYNQIDKLYYRNFYSQIDDKLGPIEYIKQPRKLYEKVNILSIPMGLYGQEIKPGSFYLSSSEFNIIDDKFGNLLLSGSSNIHDTSSYPSNPQQNVFRLDPVKGFEKYDLGVHEGYATISPEPFTVTFNNKGEEVLTSDENAPDYTKTYLKNRWRRGTRIDVNIPTTYSSGDKKPVKFYPLDKDDSYFMNNIHYTRVTFNTSSLGSTSHKFPKILFNSSTGSLISSSHSEKFNFNSDEDFSISFYIEPQGFSRPKSENGIGFSGIGFGFTIGNYSSYQIDNKKRYIFSKSKTKNVNKGYFQDYLNTADKSDDELYAISKIIPAEDRFSFEIYMQSSSLFFDMSDGNETKSVNTTITFPQTVLSPTHIFCQNSGSIMQIWKNGTLQDSTTISFKDQTRNTADLYIGGNGGSNNIDNNGGISSSSIGSSFIVGNYVSGSSVEGPKFFNGDLSNINIWSRAYNETTIKNISESINASPYIGNVFYQNGFATITHPKYHHILNTAGIGTASIGGTNSQSIFQIGNRGINTLQFQGTHLIYENEYQCTIEEHEFNDTTNITARKIKSKISHELADFTTSSLFKPHVTTIGLYNENRELLVVGKLGQPIRMSDETDTTFVLRWDT